MKSKTIIIIFIIVIVVGAGIAGWLLGRNGNNTGNQNISPQPASEKNILDEGKNIPPAGKANQATENVLATDNFSFTYPQGWRSAPAPQGVSAMVVNQNETITDPQAKKMNFKSYLSIMYDALQGKSLEQYANAIKKQLPETFPDAEFINEKDFKINTRDAHAMEILLNQGGVDFHVLMVMVRGEGDDIWILSFNTLKSLWNAYADIFSDTINTFVVKKQL